MSARAEEDQLSELERQLKKHSIYCAVVFVFLFAFCTVLTFIAADLDRKIDYLRMESK